jgi:ribosomal protein S18 acetylase RimI-like enzyme
MKKPLRLLFPPRSRMAGPHRLAVDLAFSEKGLGGALLADALARATRSGIAACAMMVDAKDEAAPAFYRHHGFIALPDSPLTLLLPLATALAARKTRTG